MLLVKGNHGLLFLNSKTIQVSIISILISQNHLNTLYMIIYIQLLRFTFKMRVEKSAKCQ